MPVTYHYFDQEFSHVIEKREDGNSVEEYHKPAYSGLFNAAR